MRNFFGHEFDPEYEAFCKTYIQPGTEEAAYIHPNTWADLNRGVAYVLRTDYAEEIPKKRAPYYWHAVGNSASYAIKLLDSLDEPRFVYEFFINLASLITQIEYPGHEPLAFDERYPIDWPYKKGGALKLLGCPGISHLDVALRFSLKVYDLAIEAKSKLVKDNPLLKFDDEIVLREAEFTGKGLLAWKKKIGELVKKRDFPTHPWKEQSAEQIIKELHISMLLELREWKETRQAEAEEAARQLVAEAKDVELPVAEGQWLSAAQAQKMFIVTAGALRKRADLGTIQNEIRGTGRGKRYYRLDEIQEFYPRRNSISGIKRT